MRSCLAVVLNSADFDYLLSKGNNNAPINRSSLLLKFDPLLGVALPINQTATNEGSAPSPTEGESGQQKQQLLKQPQHIHSTLGVKNLKSNVPRLSPTLEESDHDLRSQQATKNSEISQQPTPDPNGQRDEIPSPPSPDTTALNCTVSLSAPSDSRLDGTIICNTTNAATTPPEHHSADPSAVSAKEEATISKTEQQIPLVGEKISLNAILSLILLL